MTEDKTITGNLYGVPVTATFKGNPYTPTTEQVRAGYAWRDNVGSKTYETEFDRWLAEVKAQAWEEGITAFDQAIIKDVDDPWSQLPDNPYREEEPGE